MRLVAVIPGDAADERARAVVAQCVQTSTYIPGIKPVIVRQGDSTVYGTTAGLSDAGFLVVRKDDGSDEIVIAGGVRAAGRGRG